MTRTIDAHRHLGRRTFLQLTVMAAGAAVGTSACADDGDDRRPSGDRATEDRPLTVAEADMLAGCLFKNYDVGGARFSVAAAFQTSGDTVQLEGMIDWRAHVGHASVRAAGAEADVTEVYWTETAVLEHRAGLREALAAAGSPGHDYVDRAPDPSGRQLDGLLALVLGLAAEQRDNPQLVQQNAAARFVRPDTLRDTPVTVFSYDSAQLWLDGSGTLVRYSGTSADGNRPVTVDFADLAPVEIEPPARETVVSYDEVAAVYDALLRGG